MSDDLAPNPARGWLRVAGIVLSVGLLAWLVLIWQRAAAHLAKEPAIATAVFADGLRVEVVRCAVLPKLEHRPPRFSMGFTVGATSSSSWVHSGLHLAIRETDGRLAEASLEHQSHRPCFTVLLRASWPDGKAYSSDSFVVDEGQELLQIKRSGTLADGISLAPAGATSALDACGLLMEVEDGLGGWLSVSGPVFADTKDAHALALCPGIPRNSPTLLLRFQRPGQMPAEVSVPNPGHRPQPPVLEPEALPASRLTASYRVELQRLKLINGAPAGRFVFQPEFKIDPQGTMNTEQLMTDTFVDDAQGNSVFYSSHYHGFILLPGQRQVHLKHVLKPSAETYPWEVTDGTFIAEGAWDAAGKMPQIQINDEGRRLGFTGIQVTPAKGSATSSPSPVMRVRLEGQADEPLWRRVQGLSPELTLVLFDRSSKATGRFGGTSRSFSSLGPKYSWIGESTWSGTPAPFTTFRLAIVLKPTSEVHEFIVELPGTAAP